jgi:hypothetical protein
MISDFGPDNYRELIDAADAVKSAPAQVFQIRNQPSAIRNPQNIIYHDYF